MTAMKRMPTTFAAATLLLLLSVGFARPCAAAEPECGPPGAAVARLPVEAYAPSLLAVRTPDPKDDGHPAPGEDAWSVGPRGTTESQSRYEEFASTGAMIGAITGVTVMVIRTRGNDGLADLFEPFLWASGGLVGGAAGWIVGGAIALATDGH